MSLGYNAWSHAVFGSLSLAIDVLGWGCARLCRPLAGFRARLAGQEGDGRRLPVGLLFACHVLRLQCGGTDRTDQAGRATVKAEQAAKERSERASADPRANYITNLMEQAKVAGALAFDTSLSKRERELAKAQQEFYLKQAGEASFKPVEVEADPISKSRDAMAANLAALMGWRVVSVQEALGLAGALILMIISITLIRHGFQILPSGIRYRVPPITVPAPVYHPLWKKSRGSPDATHDLERRIIKVDQCRNAPQSRQQGAGQVRPKAFQPVRARAWLRGNDALPLGDRHATAAQVRPHRLAQGLQEHARVLPWPQTRLDAALGRRALSDVPGLSEEEAWPSA